MDIIYKRASYGDINAVSELLCVLYEMPVDEVLEENEELFADTSQAFFLALDGDKPIGCSHGSLRREYVNGTNEDLKGYLEAIYVLPEYRHRGIATELVKATEHWAVMNGCHEIASDCLLDNMDSYNFHLKIGYKETERCIFFLKELEPLDYKIKPIDDAIHTKIQPILENTWGSPLLAINGKLWDSRTMSGYAAVHDTDVLGYLLYEFHNGVCEIMALQSIAQNIGIASTLIESVKKTAKENNVTKVIAQTINDNTHAIRFYQKRGFTIREVRLEVLDVSRKLKPSIPLVGIDGIPLRDEIEFEIEV